MARPVIWTVGDKEYKLVLDGSAICESEKRVLGGRSITTALGTFGPGVLKAVSKPDDIASLAAMMGAIPSLSQMLGIIHQAAQSLNHCVTLAAVTKAYDRYCEDGGSIMSLYMDVYSPLFEGFFTVNQPEDGTTETAAE